MSARRKTVLVIDANEEARDRLSHTLRRDYRVIRASSAESGLALMDKEDVDVLVADVNQPGLSGLDLLQIVRENFPLIELIMTSEVADVDGAVSAIKLGAYHFLTKDGDPDVLRELVRHAGERQDLHRHVLTLQDAAGDAAARDFITGPSPALKDVLDTVHKVARLSATVLILGESGTGKELLARLLHRESGNPDSPFVAVNVAAIPRELVESTLFGHEKGSFTGALQQRIGKFELAHGGTLFLDEIGDLKPDLQAKLLRAIQEGEVERVGGSRPVRTQFRLIAATNVDLERAVKEGSFREDLFYRLNVIPVHVPALRDRADDIPIIAEHFLEKYTREMGRNADSFAPDAQAALRAYPWPGNVRELENVIERSVALESGSRIELATLPEHLRHGKPATPRPGDPFGDAATGFSLERHLQDIERSHLERALQRAGGVQTRAAEVLGLSFRQFRYLIKKHGLKRD